MPQDSFELACDRLSHVVDGALFERLRWERTEGPMLAHLADLARSALESRNEFELNDEGATSNLKRFVLKVHSNRVVAVSICLKDGQAVMEAEEIARSKYRLDAGPAISADFNAVDEQWMVSALQNIFSRIQISDKPAQN